MAKTRVTPDLKYSSAKLMKELLSGAGVSYMAISHISDWENNTPPPVYGSTKERNEFEYELLGMQNVPAAQIHYMIKKVTWTSGGVYDMYRHDYTTDNTSFSGATRLEDATYVVYTAQGDVYICLNNNNEAPSTVSPASTLSVPFTTSDGYQWIRAFTLTSSQVTSYSSGSYIPVISNGSAQTTVPGAVYSVVLDASGEDYTTSPVGGANQIPYYYTKVRGDGSGAVARIQVVGTSVVSVDLIRNGEDYTYASIEFDRTNAYASVEDLDAGENILNPEGSGLKTTVIIQPNGGFGANIYTDVSVGAIGLFGNLSYSALDKVTFPTFRQVGLITNPTFTTLSNTNQGVPPANVNTVKAVAVKKVFGTPHLEVGEIMEQLINDENDSPTARGTVVGIDTDVTINDDLTVDVIRYVQSPELHLDSDGNLYEFTGDNSVTGSTSGSVSEVQTSVNGFYSLLSFVGGYADSDYVKGSGDLTYLSNLQPITRTSGQQEKVSFVINF